ncbi:hypothetical protein [Paraglaciecola sp. MB-3u-78]|uniref:hypothetical protein n=1 Tax=Paraglaciecola sp. MB-3u-78 TaxID=2058332 RepID=UPI0012FF1141|nr:hypothetical protein [Paraglaciecola sp. MB-3u-78]
MNKLSRWIVLPLLAIAAIFFYSIGNTSSLIMFLILGFMFELDFRLKAFPRKNNKR